MDKKMDCIDVIERAARIPSFSSFEDKLKPFIYEYCENIPGIEIIAVPENNLIIRKSSQNRSPKVALTAHLDKINHFGNNEIKAIEFSRDDDKIIGQLDDAVGVGICLYILKEQISNNDFPIIILLSEMEESYGLKHHPTLLRNSGEKLYPRVGAERLSEYLITHEIIPELFITIDTTPLFRGESGIALYSDHWEKNGTIAGPQMIEDTCKIRDKFISLYPNIKLANNTNDYLVYGRCFNRSDQSSIPSVAIEPAIYPYHQKNETVFIEDIRLVLEILNKLFLQMKTGNI